MNHHSQSHPRRSRRSPLAAVAVLAALIAGAVLAPAASADAKTLRLFEKTRSVQLTKADGRVLSKLPIAESEPQPGDVLDVVYDLFRGDHERHGKAPIGSDHLRCAFVAGGPPACVSHVTMGRSMLVVEGTPPRITLGTGRFAGASGRVLSAREVKEAPPSRLAHNDLDVVVRLAVR